MPRFFFHLSDGSSPDTEGVELAGLDSAKAAALRLLGQSLLDRTDAFWNDRDWLLTVADGNGLTQFTVQVFATDAPSVQIAVAPTPAAGG